MQIRTFELGSLGTNCYLVWDDTDDAKEAFIVDPADFTDQVRSVVADEGLSLKYIILTHGHGDHVGGVNAILSAYPGVTLAAGKDEVSILADSSYNFTSYLSGRAETFQPDILLSDGDELTVGAIPLRVIATPGHTIGGISILIPGAVFSGDTLFRTSIGRTDLPTGDYDTLERSIRERLYTLPDDTDVYPGHMGPTTIGYEKRYNVFVGEE
ncbi:MAG: MBL fold metallo-hydrolase [Clostridiales Family XIII bacterium]|jgi:glyoxylase-like metal-dependent hydrolase (beta-lactamase superfamily II)|nr:MBL fold metallo-hydrolase [Clostridiales Family XIII bacterium]